MQLLVFALRLTTVTRRSAIRARMRSLPLTKNLHAHPGRSVEAGNISVRDRSNETHVAELDKFIAQVATKESVTLVIRFQTAVKRCRRCRWHEE